ncbi:hypothetical protein GCM10007939_04500 [Amylibacter marinus]|uniref:histidine kinase n=1 Tax=Amylibacter marinus TaxID=1475483 RepID=A0ABQ5VRX5_9RHOB|nr:PAS domain-containing protein [Amylibacter marinus]GLQ34167.1 hypothetical protein GCM10007939_04500 [Amylibacter marinus]
MHYSLFQSLSALVLAGLGCYAILVSPRLTRHRVLRPAMMGLVFGLLATLLTTNTHMIGQLPDQVYVIAGPLLFAGYLGGTVGAVMAAVLIISTRICIGGPVMGAGLYLSIGYVVSGLLAARIWAPRPWPIPSANGIMFLIISYLVFLIAPAFLSSPKSIAALSIGPLLLRMSVEATVGILSTLIVWCMVHFVVKVSQKARMNADLAQRLELAIQHSGIGTFEHLNGEEEALYDAGIIEIYGLDHQPGMVPVADWIARVHPEDRPLIMAALQAPQANEPINNVVEFRALHPSGEIRYIRAQWLTEFDADGIPARIVGTHTDLTKIKQAEAARALASSQLATVAQNLPGAMIYFITDRSTPLKPSYVSPSSLDIWGYSPEEVYAKPEVLPNTMSPDDRSKLLAALHKSIKTLSAVNHRHKITHRNGETRWLELHGSSSMIEDGMTRLDLIVLDVTKEVQQELANAEQGFQLEYILTQLGGAALSYSLPPGNETMGPEDTMSFLNRDSCYKIWGVTADEAEADNNLLWSLVSDQQVLDKVFADITRAIQTLEPFHAIVPYKTPQGKQIWLEERGYPTRLEDGTTHFFILVLDITEEVARQNELEHQKELNHHAQKQQSIGQLTAGVAHDFNNLLAVILGNLELLRDDERDSDKTSMIDAGINATKRGADLTRSMLAFARQSRLRPHSFNLNTLVGETRTWAGRTLPVNIEIETSLLAGLWTVEADPASTEAALLNLILNACDAMMEGGKLTIETANVHIDQPYMDARNTEVLPGQYAMLAVSDTGHGISDAQVSQIFDPFFSTKAPGAGSGLGLSMVQGFMEQSGGMVQVYSELGIGTTFKLYFPAKDVNLETKHKKAPTNPRSATGDLEILLVEDEAEVRSVLATLITKAGYRVSEAHSGDEALAIFAENQNFDLLVTDIVMPGKLQGTELCKALRKLKPNLPVIFMSGYASETTVHGNDLRPEDIRLMKPVQRDDFLLAIIEAMDLDGARSLDHAPA